MLGAWIVSDFLCPYLHIYTSTVCLVLFLYLSLWHLAGRMGLCCCHLLLSVRAVLWVIVHQAQSTSQAKACRRLGADPKCELTAEECEPAT